VEAIDGPAGVADIDSLRMLDALRAFDSGTFFAYERRKPPL
jgi:hypothetical protein